MQHYMPIKLWSVIAAKTVVHDDKTAKMRRYIAVDYTMLHNVVQICHIMLRNFAFGGEKSLTGIGSNKSIAVILFLLSKVFAFLC